MSEEVNNTLARAGLLTPQQAADHLGVTVRTLEAWRWSGRGPQYVRISARCVRYRHCDLDAFVEQRLATNTGQQA